MVMLTRRHESGAVSLFLVIFAMLLITIVTLSFLRIMVNDQQQATANDLSQSARDSALAGVEDAKRALIHYRTVCNSGDVSLCADTKNIVNSPKCNEGLQNVIPYSENREVAVQQSQSAANDALLNQAYTCVKMKLETVDYVSAGAQKANTSKLIPLKSTAPITAITVEWYVADDLGGAPTSVNLFRKGSPSLPLFSKSDWAQSRPSLMRAQLMQYGSTFNLVDFDNSTAINSNANTLFLYPVGTTGSTTAPSANSYGFATDDTRKTPTGSPREVHCKGALVGGGYACMVTIDLPQAVGQSDNNRTAFLRLTPLYNASHFRVTLNNGALFDGVQPSVDSTGRANDLYRRIESRVDLVDTNFPFPEAAVDLTGNLCKDFIVTDTASDFATNCQP